MTTENWPATLPIAPAEDGYRESAGDNLARTTMDVGPAKVRRRSTAAPRQFSATFQLSLDQVSTLDGFYVTTLVGGSLSFNWSHPRTGVAIEVRFLAPPEYSSQGGDEWLASCRLEQLV